MSLSIYHTHTHSLGRVSEREKFLGQERDYCYREIMFMFSGFILVLILSLRKLRGFLLYDFPEENLWVYCLLSLIAMLVIVFVKDPKIMLA